MVSETPAISILMTLHNRERFVEAAVRSVLTQTRGDLELIIVDDGSTDGSLAIARRLGAADGRVRVVEREHSGAMRTLAAAHALARGELIGWVDSDDLLVNTAVEETAGLLEADPALGMVYTDHLVIDAQGKPKGMGHRCRIPYSPLRLLTDFMTFHFRLFRRWAFDLAGGIDTSMSTSADYDLCLRMSEVTQIRHLQRVLYCYREHADSISVSRRIEQIQNSAAAVERAIVRRGMAATHVLEVDVEPTFRLVRRDAPAGHAGAGA
ncbi:MAG: glycosyltransferase [Planctomycetota bacterium]